MREGGTPSTPRRCQGARTTYVCDRSVIEETVATQLDLVCGDLFKSNLDVRTTVMLGLAAGCLVGGTLGDHLGRKSTLIGALALVTLRFIVLTCVSILWLTSHTLIMEHFGRSVVNTSEIFLPLVASYAERHWKYTHLWTGVMAVWGR